MLQRILGIYRGQRHLDFWKNLIMSLIVILNLFLTDEKCEKCTYSQGIAMLLCMWILYNGQRRLNITIFSHSHSFYDENIQKLRWDFALLFESGPYGLDPETVFLHFLHVQGLKADVSHHTWLRALSSHLLNRSHCGASVATVLRLTQDPCCFPQLGALVSLSWLLPLPNSFQSPVHVKTKLANPERCSETEELPCSLPFHPLSKNC